MLSEHSNITLVGDDDVIMLTKWFLDMRVCFSGASWLMHTGTVRVYILRVLCLLRYLSTFFCLVCHYNLALIFPLCLGQVVASYVGLMFNLIEPGFILKPLGLFGPFFTFLVLFVPFWTFSFICEVL